MSILAEEWLSFSSLWSRLGQCHELRNTAPGRGTSEQTGHPEILKSLRSCNFWSFENVKAGFSKLNISQNLLHSLHNMVRFTEHQSFFGYALLLFDFKFFSEPVAGYLGALKH